MKVQLEKTLKQNHDLQSEIGKLALHEETHLLLKEKVEILVKENSDLQVMFLVQFPL